jgi:hypothetical protein
VAWSTHEFILTMEECAAVQRAILHSAGFSGVQLLTWTVLPNQAGAVIRVPKPEEISDESLVRRIALLRGDKTAAGVKASLEAAVKTGDKATASKLRSQWTGSMGSAAGFLSVVRTVPVVQKALLGGLPLWKTKPLRMHFLKPDTRDLLRAAGIVDSAAVRSLMVTSASAWPYCGYTAAMRKYKPALYGTAVLMQRNPYRDLPPTPREDLLNALAGWQRFLNDFPQSAEEPLPPPAAAATVPGGAQVTAPVP